MSTQTLKHHRKTGNRYEFGFGAQTVTVTRRFLANRSVRIRVTSTTFSGEGEGNWSEYRDYTDMHEGDAAYMKQANAFCAKWEERYVNFKKETPAVSDTTPEPPQEPTATQWAGGATMTPSKAAELATRRTGIQHVVGEDGRTLCQRPAATDSDPQPSATVVHTIPPNATVRLTREGERVVLADTPTGRILGTYTYRVRGNRPTRTGAMGTLLVGTASVVTEARTTLAAHANTGLTGHAETDNERTRYVMELQAHTAYFSELLEAGYANDTTWDELVAMLRPLLAKARAALPEGRLVLNSGEQPDTEGERRAMVAALLFLKATEGVRYFFEDPDDNA